MPSPARSSRLAISREFTRGRASAAAFLSFFRRKLPNIERPIVFVREDAVISPSPSSSSPTSLSVDFLRAWGSLRLNVPCFEGPSDIAAARRARRKGSELRAASRRRAIEQEEISSPGLARVTPTRVAAASGRGA